MVDRPTKTGHKKEIGQYGGGRKPIPEAEMQRNLVMERMLEIVKHKGESHESRNQK